MPDAPDTLFHRPPADPPPPRPPAQGYPIVLTADRSLMAAYPTLFEAMVATSQTTLFPEPVVKALLMRRRPPLADGRSAVAPVGLRRVESALMDGGFTAADVAVVDPDDLSQAIGPATRVVAVSTGDPLGRGMSSTTMTAVLGGAIYPARLFERLAETVRRLKRHHGGFKVLAGGPGAWQLALDEPACRRLGIDHVVTGFCEAEIAPLMRSLVDGTCPPRCIACASAPPERIPPLRGATLSGAIEISRGCGLGCGFCSLSREPMRHLPAERICGDARTQVACGQPNISLLSEDFFRYGARGRTPEPDRLIALLERLRAIGGIGLIQTDHAAICSVASIDDDQLMAIRRLMVGGTGCQMPWLNLGVETASERLLHAAGAGAKRPRSAAGTWAGVCAEQIDRLIEAGFFPLVSLVLGLPGETSDDLRQTLRWVESMAHKPLGIFPVCLAPLDAAAQRRPKPLSPLHYALIERAYRVNFREVPRLVADNQKAAGVGAARRRVIRMMGWGNVALWKTVLTLHNP